MRLAVVSDIHGNLPALEAVLAEIGREGVDRVVNLGDIVSGPLWPRETAARLRGLDWPTIRGNHERQLLDPHTDRMGAADAFARARLAGEDLRWLAALPATLDLGGGIWCCHGTPDSDLAYFLESVTPDLECNGSPGVRAATASEVAQRLGAVTSPLVLCGHTHMPRALQSGDTLIVNPAASVCRLSTTTTRTRTAWKPEARTRAGRWSNGSMPAGRCSSGRPHTTGWPRHGVRRPTAGATGPMRC